MGKRYVLALRATAGIALTFCLAFGWGSYALAPGGAYVDWTMQGVSHDWHRYLWFFQIPSTAWLMLIVLGAFAAAVYAVALVPCTLIASAVLFRLCPRAGEWLSRSAIWVGLTTFIFGYTGGIVDTIIAGRNPGIP